MYHILEEVVGSTAQGDKEKVMELNKRYEGMVEEVYHMPRTKVEAGYDNCRQSCVLSFTMPKMRDNFIKHLKENFRKLPKPEN